jgi:hypothetical protein
MTGKTITVNVEPTSTIGDVKEKLIGIFLLYILT